MLFSYERDTKMFMWPPIFHLILNFNIPEYIFMLEMLITRMHVSIKGLEKEGCVTANQTCGSAASWRRVTWPGAVTRGLVQRSKVRRRLM